MQPIKYAKSKVFNTEPLLIFNVDTSAFPISVAAITAPNDPPAPVINNTTPACFSASLAEFSTLFLPRYL